MKQPRLIGIDQVPEAPWGTHFCLFYRTRQDLIDLLVPYFKTGLENNEFCMWVTSDPLRASDARASLGKAVQDLALYESRGQIEILDYSEWYTRSGRFDSDRVLAGWVEKEKRAVQRGFDGLRLTGNTFWLEEADWHAFIDYEAAVDSVISQYHMLALCTYSLDKCDATEVIDVTNHHQFALAKRGGDWQMIESADRRRAEQARRYATELEVRVAERTRELQALNAQLTRENIERQKREKELAKLNRTLKAHNESSQALMRAEEEIKYLEQVCRVIVEDCGHAMVWIGYAEDDESKSVRPIAYFGFEGRYLESLHITWADAERGRGPTGTAIRTGKPTVCPNMLTDPRFLPWREEALKRGYASSIALPLLTGGKAFGALSIYSREPEAFSEDEVKLLSDLADDLAYGITMLRLRRAHSQAEAALRQSEERYRNLFESMNEGFALHEIICNEQGMPVDYRFLDLNPAFVRLTGLKREAVLGKTAREVLPQQEEFWIETYGRVALTGEPVHFENYSAAPQQYFEVAAYCPAPMQFAVLLLNITERKQAEEEIRQLNQNLARRAVELEAANKELEAFSYSVSHDLRAPLRSISGFGDALSKEFAAKLDDQAKHYLDRILINTHYMGELIDDLLTLSRLTRQDIQRERVDLSAQARAIIAEHCQREPTRKAQVTIADRMWAHGDARLLHVALENLLDNAWKFTGSRTLARIEFGATTIEGKHTFFVRDNGVGFDMRYADKLFSPFQRLHRLSEFPGTGIGLATVARIVQRHSGRVWADAAVDQGATFYFVLNEEA